MYIIARDKLCSKLSSEVLCTLMLPRESEQQRSQVTYHTVGTCYGYQVCCHHILHSTAHKLSGDIHVLQNSHSHPMQLISNLREYHQSKRRKSGCQSDTRALVLKTDDPNRTEAHTKPAPAAGAQRSGHSQASL